MIQLAAQHMQCTIALQVSRGPPRKTRTVKGKTAGSVGLSLALPNYI